ncbi:hypothetical protein GF358_00645 [Candidatus Woesearchaeota archaeon]|nr:hypothetical protein [Candidatus Woesearchaeota archaeon]
MKKEMVLLTILLLIAGCTPGTQQPDKETQPADYRSGNQGLRISFVPNMPPHRIFDTDEINVLIELENMGAYTTEGPADRVYLSGFDPAILSGIKTSGKSIPRLEGKGPYISRGATDRVSFSGIPAILSVKNIDKYPLRLLATACYEYQTIASANICIDPNPYKLSTTEKVCTPKSVSMGGGQGAPIAVTNIDVEASPGLTRLRIDVRNTGGGEVFKPGIDTMQRCSPYTSGLGFDEIDYVRITDVSMPGYSIMQSCRPLDQGYLRLVNGKGTLYCEINTRGQSVYMTPVTIKLDYGYKNVIFKDTEIISVQ